MIDIQVFTFNAFGENTYVLSDPTGEALIIDPGCYERHEQKELKDYILGKKLSVKYLLNTHCHIDHVLGNAFVKRTFNVPLLIPALEVPYLKAVETYAPVYGFEGYEPSEADALIDLEKPIKFGENSLKVIFTPGHSAGHVVFYHAQQGFCINGDVLFRRSIGRTDLPGGDHKTLMHSIQTKMFSLPPETVVYTGHGEPTTIAYEMKYNPFLN